MRLLIKSQQFKTIVMQLLSLKLYESEANLRRDN